MFSRGKLDWLSIPAIAVVLLLAHGECAKAQAVIRPDVKVMGRDLLVDFDHDALYDKYLVKGVAYSPFPTYTFPTEYGACEFCDPVYGCLYSGSPTSCAGPQPAPFFLSENFVPVFDRADVNLTRDMSLIAAMGANTIRTWERVTDQLLQAAGAAGIKVIAGFWVNYDDGFGSPLDFSNPAVRNDLLTKFSNYVTYIKNLPSSRHVLMFAIGNENNYHLLAGAPAAQNWYSLVNQMAIAAHTVEDPGYATGGKNYHPVMIVNGEINNVGSATYGTRDIDLPDINIWGANVYRDIHFNNGSMVNIFDEFAPLSTKPLLITEFGTDAYDNNAGMENQAAQSLWDRKLWDVLVAHASASISATPANRVGLGGVVMEYSDEYYKTPPVQQWTANTGIQETGGLVAFGQAPDNYLNEEYWGIVSIANGVGNGAADAVTPRSAYYSLQKRYQCPSPKIHYAGPDNNKSYDGSQACCPNPDDKSLRGHCAAQQKAINFSTLTQ